MEKMNDTGELFKLDLKGVEKVDKTQLKVNSESDLFVDLDDSWHVSLKYLKKELINSFIFQMWVQAFHNKENKEEFDEKPTFSMPKKGACAFLNTTYRQYFWEHVKDSSNLPPPETCPIKAVSKSKQIKLN